MELVMTLHAQKRLQQRGIPHFVVDLLDAFGATERCGGAERLYFDRATGARINRTQAAMQFLLSRNGCGSTRLLATPAHSSPWRTGAAA